MQTMTTKTLEAGFGARLTAARGDLSMAEVVYRVRSLLGGYSLSVATISRYESGATKESGTDPLIVWALARVLGVPLKELSPRAAMLVALVSDPSESAARSGCPVDWADEDAFSGIAA